FFLFLFFFFFSSRRRHTRFSRDWSSDVCSSDLAVPKVPGVNHLDAVRAIEKAGFGVVRQGKHIRDDRRRAHPDDPAAQSRERVRSEERRVGKECRSRGWREHLKKKKKM